MRTEPLDCRQWKYCSVIWSCWLYPVLILNDEWESNVRDSCVFVAPFILQSEMVVGLTNGQFVNLTESFQWTAKSSNVEQPMPISKPYSRDAKSMSLLKVWKTEPELKFCDLFFRHLLNPHYWCPSDAFRLQVDVFLWHYFKHIFNLNNSRPKGSFLQIKIQAFIMSFLDSLQRKTS